MFLKRLKITLNYVLGQYVIDTRSHRKIHFLQGILHAFDFFFLVLFRKKFFSSFQAKVATKERKLF